MEARALGEAQEVRGLIGQCLAGDRGAITRFQETYGELIYGYPIQAYRTPAEDAGDFYVFAFEKGRIFRRIRTYEGRAPFRAYLVGAVLGHLVLEWRRGKRDIEVVSMEALGEFTDETDSGFSSEPVSPARPQRPLCDHGSAEESDEAMDMNGLSQFLQTTDPSKAVVLKLLYVEDFALSPAEIRHLAEASGQSVADVVEAVERLRNTVRQRQVTAKGIEDKLDTVHAWIQLHERRLRRIAQDLAALPPRTTAAARLREEQLELERKVEQRHRQRDKVLARRQRRKLTAPYKEIAALLNTTVGNVGSQIARLRQEVFARVSSRGLGLGGKDA